MEPQRRRDVDLFLHKTGYAEAEKLP